MDVLITGLVAGIALAIPLGPMAILLIGTTLRHGKRIGIFGALAMALVDFSYAALVFGLGSIVTNALEDWVMALRIFGSTILIAIAVRIFLTAIRTNTSVVAEASTEKTTKLKTFGKFFALTVINPATAFYFLGITPSVAALSNETSTSGLGSAILIFALGVFIGSVIWQLGLVMAAGLTRKYTQPKIQSRIQILGAGLIVALALALLLQ